MSAAEKELGDLHAMVAKGLKAELQMKDEQGRVPAQYYAQAIKFLKDNNIEASGEYSKELQELSEEFPFDNVVNLK